MDTTALPLVVLKLGAGDEFQDAANLFLKAFGSEAESVDECQLNHFYCWKGSLGNRPVWRNFVFTAFGDDVAIKPEELTAWFIASGWDELASADLTNQFYKEAAYLGDYEARRQPA